MAADTREDTVPPVTDDLTPVAPTLDPRPAPPAIDVPALAAVLDGRYADVRALVRRNLEAYASVLEEAETLTRDDYRDRVRDIVVEMAATGQTGMGFPEEHGGGGDIGASVAAFETLAFGDLSVLVKVGVQFGLFGGAILQLGTKPHHDAYLRDLVTGKLMGCFAMTETGHGSNVQALGTVAVYEAAISGVRDHHTGHEGGEEAGKDYIGNAARHARVAVLFAQLETLGEGRGVHAFVVPIRDASGAPADRRTDRGRRPQARPQRRRQRPAVVRRRAGATGGAARPVRPGGRGRRLLQRDREPEPPLLHDAGHAGPGPGLRRRRRASTRRRSRWRSP